MCPSPKGSPLGQWFITVPTGLQKVIWYKLNKILWQLIKGLQWVNNLLLTQWVSRGSIPKMANITSEKSPNVKRPIHPTVLTPIPGARHDKITLLSGASRVKIHRTRSSRESSNEIEPRVIERERDRAESHQTRPSRESSNETRPRRDPSNKTRQDSRTRPPV